MLESFKSSNFEYKKLTEEEQQKRGILGRLVGPIADFKNPTRNGRKYTEKLWEKVYSDPIVKEKIENRCLFCELGHPEDRLEVDPEKICACIAEIPKKSDDGKLYTVIDILDTPNGRILKTLLDYGTTVGISSRGEGDLISDYNGDEIVDPDTYQYETSDIVLLPAVKSARLTPVTESLNKKTLKQALLEDINKSNDSDKLVMNETLESLGIKLNEGIQYKGFDMNITQSGVQLRKSDGSFIQEFPTEQEAKEYVDEMSLHESLSAEQREKVDEISERYNGSKPVSGSWDTESKHELLTIAKELGISKRDALDVMVDYLGFDQDELMDQLLKEEISDESSIKDVNIQKEGEQEEADNAGDNLVTELQEMMLKNADLEKLVKSLQERLSVCYAKEKRYEGQLGTYKNSVQTLQEGSKKAVALESKVSELQKQLQESKASIGKKDEELSTLKEDMKELSEASKKVFITLKEERLSHKKSVETLNSKIQSLEEDLSNNKKESEKSIKVLKESYKQKSDSNSSKIAEMQKDFSQRENQLKESLEKANQLTTKYKNIATKAVDKYIVEKTRALGISDTDVKNRLGKSYSFNDIDRICEGLSQTKLAINKLPFSGIHPNNISIELNESEQSKPSILQSSDDFVSEGLMRLAGL